MGREIGGPTQAYCPGNREAKIAQFAKKYGFRLRFYSKGCAPSSTNGRGQIANDAGDVIETHEHTGDFKEW